MNVFTFSRNHTHAAVISINAAMKRKLRLIYPEDFKDSVKFCSILKNAVLANSSLCVIPAALSY